MFTFFAFAMIFLETSLAVDFPYSVFSITYINYIIYEKQERGFYYAIFVAFLVAISGNSVEGKMFFFGIYSIVVYCYSKYILYEKQNIPLIVLVQVCLYLPYLYYFESRLPSFGILIKMFMFYSVANYIYLQKITLSGSK